MRYVVEAGIIVIRIDNVAIDCRGLADLIEVTVLSPVSGGMV